jgi:hypothetical protein
VVLSAYQSLSEEDKMQTIIAANNYGQAGALELFGEEYFPQVVSNHNNYYLWRKERLKGNILLQLGQDGNYNGLNELFEVVEIFRGEFQSKYVSMHENNLKVFICRQPKIPFAEMLERGKNYH